jgi:N-acyl-phosphatidylethanolamine-hydrolysing phospholipase D
LVRVCRPPISHFREIGEVLGPFTLSLVPIGAYEPREFLRQQHINPEEAVSAHVDLRSKWSMG